MNRKYLVALLVIVITASYANGYDKIFEFHPQDAADFRFIENGITISNLKIVEKDAFLATGISKVHISFSIVNANSENKALTVMFAGFSAKQLEWTIDSGPPVAIALSNKTVECVDTTYVPPGTLKNTEKIWIRIVGDF